ncbi:MAG: sugar transferase [Solirubrobacterales bacterium]|nr:sugar transferase [Solirubrobacterales bacterium]
MTYQTSRSKSGGGVESDATTGVKARPDPARVGSNPGYVPQSFLVRKRAQLEGGSKTFKYAFHRLLLASDLLAVLVGTALTALLLNLLNEPTENTAWYLTILGMSPFLVALLYVAGIYSHVEEKFNIDFVSEGARVTVVATLWCWLLMIVSSLTVGEEDVTAPLLMWLCLVPLLLLFRSIARSVARGRPWYQRKVALVGDAATVAGFQQRVGRHTEWGLTVGLAVVRADGKPIWDVSQQSPDGSLSKIAELDDAGAELLAHRVVDLAQAEGIDRVIVAGGTERMSKRVELVETMLSHGLAVDDISGGPESLFTRAMPQQLEGLRLLSSRPPSLRPAEVLMKRVMDVVVSSAFLIVTSPVMAMSALAIKLDSKGPVFFRQPRAGFEGEVFQVCKLRTMSEDADSMREELWNEGMHGEGGMLKIKNDPRVTRVGKWLRRTSIDEIPQFWNVLVGDMSLVGPRPLPLDEAARIDPKYDARNLVRPGITGPWQVMGRSEIPMEEMLKLDYAYVNGWSLEGDFRTLLRTIPAVTGKKGVF